MWIKTLQAQSVESDWDTAKKTMEQCVRGWQALKELYSMLPFFSLGKKLFQGRIHSLQLYQKKSNAGQRQASLLQRCVDCTNVLINSEQI